jgi:glycosyltransferase involved in cell wall biosynthesis
VTQFDIEIQNLVERLEISIILPALNEAVTIASTITALHEELPNAKVILVDNNSDDATVTIANKLLRANRDLLISEPVRGKGRAVFTALGRVKSDIYIFIDADSTYDASDARRLCEILLRGRHDMVVGDRLSYGAYDATNTRFGHSLGNRILSAAISRTSEIKYIDMMSGLRVVSSPLINSFTVTSTGFQLETELSLFAAQIRADVREHQISYRERPRGSESKLSSVRDGIKILIFAIKNYIKQRPLVPLLMLSTLMTILFLLLAYRVIHGFINTQLPYSTTAVGASTCLLVGILSFILSISIQINTSANNQKIIAQFLRDRRNWNSKLDQYTN